MSKTLFGMDSDGFLKAIELDIPRFALEEAIVDLYEQLYCDEDRKFNESESTAAYSAADFVEACKHIIQRLDRFYVKD